MSDEVLILIGWLLFLASAAGFIIASWGEFWPMLASVLFFVACVVFLIPILRRRR